MTWGSSDPVGVTPPDGSSSPWHAPPAGSALSAGKPRLQTRQASPAMPATLMPLSGRDGASCRPRGLTRRLRDRKRATGRASASENAVPFGSSVVSGDPVHPLQEVASEEFSQQNPLQVQVAAEPTLRVFQELRKYPPWGGWRLAPEWQKRGREGVAPSGASGPPCPLPRVCLEGVA